jgi:hypothetical protein
MRRRTKSTVIAAVALALVCALAFPAGIAVAGSLRTAAGGSAMTTAAAAAAAAKRELLKSRVSAAISRRNKHFDAASSRISSSISRLSTLASKIKALGGDVSGAQSNLATAKKNLDNAKKYEARAIEQFRAVPNSSSPRAAFMNAKSTARQATQFLSMARQSVRQAGAQLKEAVRQLALKGRNSGG